MPIVTYVLDVVSHHTEGMLTRPYAVQLQAMEEASMLQQRQLAEMQVQWHKHPASTAAVCSSLMHNRQWRFSSVRLFHCACPLGNAFWRHMLLVLSQ